MDKGVTIESYNQTAEQYAANVAGLFLREEAETFLSYLPQNSVILDIGCGSGRDAKEFTSRGYKVIGIDLSEKMIEISRKNAPNAEFRLMDIVEMEFFAEHFEGAWSIASLLHIPKKKIPKAISSVYNALKKGGIWYMSVKEGDGEVVKPDARYGGVEKFWSFFREEEMKNYLQNANFEILKSGINQAGPVSWVNVLCRKF